MIKIFMVTLVFMSMLGAEEVVTKTAFINATDAKEKSLQEVRDMLMLRVKRAAASEIFGDYINSTTIVSEGKLASDKINAIVNGVIHVKGDPQFSNGKNFGDMQVRATMYATDQEIAKAKMDLEDYVKALKKRQEVQQEAEAKALEKKPTPHADKKMFDEPLPTDQGARLQVDKARNAFDQLDEELD